MFDFRLLLIVIPALPLAAAIFTAVAGPRMLGEKSHWPCIVALGGAFVCSVLVLIKVQHEIENEGHVRERFEHTEDLWTWALVDGAMADRERTTDRDFQIDVTLRADGLTAIMLCMVTLVATLVAIYSVSYMHGDRSCWRFFSYLSVFVFSMVMLVSVSNFLLLFVFWEAVGVCSYLLIGFWYEKPEAASAGKKAFLVNRVGDFGFALALFLIWTTYGSLNFHDDTGADGVTQVGVLGETRLSGDAAFESGGTAFAICLLLMLGACGKSAQFPLHVWLPDAMEGPTPVSALIHAATMVTAGVYMVARCTPLFMASPDAQLVVACVGGGTALMAGVIAMTQNDLKRVLAYSTISQLGYMFLALGVGTLAGVAAAIFHLITHAFFKAVLFLGAGSIMHGMGNVIDMRRFGGLRSIMPITCTTCLIGCIALAGVPPLAGFWSKDAILGAVHDRIHEADHELYQRGSAVVHAATERDASVYATMATPRITFHRQAYRWLYGMGICTAFLTAFYTFRAFFMTFMGTPLVPEEADGHADESPAMMWIPLAVLSVFALFIGLVMHTQGHPDGFMGILLKTPSLGYPGTASTTQPGTLHLNVAGASMLMAVAGIGLAAYLYLGDRREIRWLTYVLDLEWLHRAAELRWVAAVADLALLRFIQRASEKFGMGWLIKGLGYLLWMVIGVVLSPLLVGYYLSPFKLSKQKFYFDELYEAALVAPLRATANALFRMDRGLIDGFVNLCGKIALATGSALRRLQNGLIPFYGLAMVLAAFALFAVSLLWASS